MVETNYTTEAYTLDLTDIIQPKTKPEDEESDLAEHSF